MGYAGTLRRIPGKPFHGRLSAWPAMEFAIINDSGVEDHIE
jgi:hypothetical protein